VTQVTFDRAMDPTSVAAALLVEPPVSLDRRWEGNTLHLEPQEPLAPDTPYRFALSTAATGVEGTPLGQARHWGYVTRNPIAGVVQPVRNGARSTPLLIRFAAPMATASVTDSLRIEPPIAGEFSWSEGDSLLMLAPTRPLPSKVAYTIHFDGALRDAAGNEFPPPKALQFTTPPAILSVSPVGESLYSSTVIEILFDRPMDARATQNAVQITPEMPGRFHWKGTRLIFEPDNGWTPFSAYTATVTTVARDQDGQPILNAPYTWSFQTGESVTLLEIDETGETACDASSSVGMDIAVRPLLPHQLAAGDRGQILAVVSNQSTCSRRVYAYLTSDLLTVEGLVTRTLVLKAGEQRVVNWMATADRAGGGQVIAQAVSGVDGDVVRSPVNVRPLNDAGETPVAAGNVHVRRTYLDAESGHTGDRVPLGQVVQVHLQVEMPDAGKDIVVEDRLPAGLEALQPQTVAADQQAYTYQVQDDVVRLYVPQLDAGRHTLTYLALATYGGAYNAPPAEVYSTRNANLWGRSDGGVLKVDVSAGASLAKLLAGGGGEYYDWMTTCVGGTDNPNDEPYDAMFFEEYGVNPFVDTDEDNLSTFAVDVDTGSYTIMRYYVNDGNLPPDESVRVEEYVNYFDQAYAPPAEGEGAFAIHLEGAPSLYGGEQHHLVRVGLQGYLPASDDRPDVVLTFVIDVSGSMNRQDRLELVKDALVLLVEELRPSDRIGIAVYGSRGYQLLPHTPVSEAGTILAAINRLEPEGSTNAEEGLRIGYRMATEAFDSEAINRVILCSDGVANVGNTGHETIWAQIEDYADQRIYLTTVGFGMGNYNDVLMEQLADHGDGFYAYVDTLAEARRLFVYELPSTLQVIARDARIQVEFNPAVVRSYRLIGYENRDVADEDFRDDDLDAGEIGLGHSVTALYEIKFWEGASTADPALTAYVRYENPDTRETVEINRSVSWGEFAGTFEAASPRFQLTAVVAEYAEVLRHSYWAKESSLQAVLAQARRVAGYFSGDEDVAEFLELVERASTLNDEE
jgi:Ca-activated chloride channel family protein